MLRSPESLEQEIQDLVDLQLEVSRKKDPLPESASLKPLNRARTRDTLDVDQVYLINLERRGDRLERMKYDFGSSHRFPLDLKHCFIHAFPFPFRRIPVCEPLLHDQTTSFISSATVLTSWESYPNVLLPWMARLSHRI